MKLHPAILVAVGLVLVTGIIFITGCSGDDKPTEPGGIPPTNLSPADSATVVYPMPTLAWSYPLYDPNIAYFDVYLGTTDPPHLFASHVTDTVFKPGPLATSRTYYWKVVSHSLKNGATAESPIFSFSTAATFTFPITVGNRWEYRRLQYNTNFSPESLASMYGDTITGAGTTEILTVATLLDSLELYMFHTTWTNGQFGDYSDMYRRNLSDGLYEYAYTSSGTSVYPPKKPQAPSYHFQFKGRIFDNLNDLAAAFCDDLPAASKSTDDPHYEPHPIQELEYPLQTGNRWAYRRTDLGDPWDMDKEIVGAVDMPVPAGDFDCYQIQWYWDIDDNGQWDTDIAGEDFICAGGTVRRTFHFYDIFVYDNMMNPLGSFDMVDDYQLTDYEIK